MVEVTLHRLGRSHKALGPSVFGVHAVRSIVDGSGIKIGRRVGYSPARINTFIFVRIGMGGFPAIHFPIVNNTEHTESPIVGSRIAQGGIR